MRYNVNFKHLVAGLLPYVLRGNVIELAYVLTHPFRVLHHRFCSHRAEKLYQLRYNCCVGSLQRMLNDYFADAIAIVANGSRILVDDREAVEETYVFPEAEHNPVMVGCVDIFPMQSWGYRPFVVRVPQVFEGDSDMLHRIIRLVNEYKLTGTSYTVEYYG